MTGRGRRTRTTSRGNRRAPASSAAPAARTERPNPAPAHSRAGQVGLVLGIGAMLALPISYQWVLRPLSVPAGLEALVPVLQLSGIVAAGAALLLGRRARAAGDRSEGAVWAPRLGAAAMVGYVMMLVLTTFRPG